MKNLPVGQVRPSQLLWTYGPGALIDLPNLSVVTMGLDRWDENQCLPVDEARLLANVRKILGPQVERLRMPPSQKIEGATPFTSEALIGVPVRPFPRWLRCVRCGALSEFDSGLFDIKENPYRPEETCFVHKNCEKGNNSDAVPARFLIACRNGHLDDFPWHWFVHQGQSSCKGSLRFYEQGASLQTQNLWVRCDGCSMARSLVHAFGNEAVDHLPGCRGRHPHLGVYDEVCDEAPRAVLLGATNSWFSVSVSVLAIPVNKSPLLQLISDGWSYFFDLESAAELKAVLKTLQKTGTLRGIEAFDPNEIWKCIELKKNGEDEQALVTEEDIKTPEWKVFTDPKVANDWPNFLSKQASVPPQFKEIIKNVLLLERLREVNALVGFTRIEAPEETTDPDDRPPMASLCKGKPSWIPVSEVHGEGIFIRFHEQVITKWESLKAVRQRDEILRNGHSAWRTARKLDPNKGYPESRYIMLHTFAHLLIRELALECGYNSASIRERIYSGSNSEEPMAGILFYTAAADSDGTLGGLVELGKPENLGRLISAALQRATVCSSDPLCSEHSASSDRSLHSAACHACSFLAETSCERGNRYLDRSLVVKTFDCSEAAIFGEYVR